MKREISKWMTLAVIFAAGVLLVTGCREQGPVELIDVGEPGQIEIISPPPQPVPGMEISDADSSGIIPLPPGKFMAHLLVAGARFDAPGIMTEASASRAIFFDAGSPVGLPNGALAYHTLDMGDIDLDGNRMWKTQKRIHNQQVDTLLGVQYILFNMRMAGFQYAGGKTYQWQGTGNGTAAPFTIRVLSPPKLVIQSPSYAMPVSVSGDLRVRWSGGGPGVRLVISRAGDSRVDTHPILHLRLGKNRGGAVIPARVMALLPRDQNRFVFTFFSDVIDTARIDGYPDGVLVQALTSHSVLVELTR